MRLYLRSGCGKRKFFRRSNYPFVMRAETLEAELAGMRKRQARQKRELQDARILLIHPHRDAVIRNREAAREAARIESGKQRMSPEQLHAARREKSSFQRMTWYLMAQEKAVHLERYVTAIYGCKTSWSRVEAHAIYAVVPEGRTS